MGHGTREKSSDKLAMSHLAKSKVGLGFDF